MSTRFEYKVIELIELPNRNLRTWQWYSQCGDLNCPPEELGSLLNRMGKDGWAVSVLSASERNPNSLILQRPIFDDAIESAPISVPRRGRPPKVVPDPQLSAFTTSLVAEVQGLRQDIANLPIPQISVAPTIDEATIARLEAIAEKPSPINLPAQLNAVIDPQMLATLEKMMRLALERPQHATLDSESIRWIETAISRSDGNRNSTWWSRFTKLFWPRMIWER